jgi:hypothetical protein
MEWSVAIAVASEVQIYKKGSLSIRGSNVQLGKTRSIGDLHFNIL